MKFVIESGTPADIDELEKLYDDLNAKPKTLFFGI